jgi:hypothetical protein
MLALFASTTVDSIREKSNDPSQVLLTLTSGKWLGSLRDRQCGAGQGS